MNKGILIKYERVINGKAHKMSDKQIAKLQNFLLSNDLHCFWKEVDMSDNNERMKFQLGEVCNAIKENMENIHWILKNVPHIESKQKSISVQARQTKNIVRNAEECIEEIK